LGDAYSALIQVSFLCLQPYIHKCNKTPLGILSAISFCYFSIIKLLHNNLSFNEIYFRIGFCGITCVYLKIWEL
jgi:hypothetical protein